MLKEDDYCLWLDVDLRCLEQIWNLGYSYDNVNCMRWPETVVGICQVIESDVEQDVFLVRTIDSLTYPSGVLKGTSNWRKKQHFYAKRRQLIKVERR